jgi:hypothetical protein
MKLESAFSGRRFTGRWARPAEILVASILMCSGALKLVSSLQGDALLAVPDPVLALQTGHLFVAAGLIEVLIALAVARPGHPSMKLLLITAFSLCVTVYRLVRVVGGTRFLTCPCLGSGLARWPALNARVPQVSAAFYITVLLANLYLALAFLARRQEVIPASGEPQGCTTCH